MIPTELEHKILRLYFVEQWKVGTIARQVGVHHSTVRRVLHTQGLPERSPPRQSIVDPYVPFIEQTLSKWPTLPASRLYQMVRQRGYTGSPGHFRRIIARMRPRKPAEAFQRLSTLRGEQAQVDWAHCGKVQVGRAVRTLSAFVMVLSWSRMTFVRFFYDQRLGSFMTGHQDAFRALRGVPTDVLYDNLKSVVAQRRDNAVRFNPTFLAFSAHYQYEAKPVAPYRGNEKGIVERRIRDLRSSFLSGRTERGLEALNHDVARWCRQTVGGRRHPADDTLTVRQAWEEEKPLLRSLPDDLFPADDRVQVRVGKTPYARFERNDYSVPHDQVRRTLVVLASPQTVRILDGDHEVARHRRCFDKGRQIDDAAHLAALRAKKLQARKGSGTDRLAHAIPSSRLLLEGAASRGHNLGAAVAGMLRLLDTWGSEAVESAVQEAMQADCFHVAAVRQLLEVAAQRAGTPPPIPIALPDDPKVRNVQVRPHALSEYDALGGRRG